MKLEQVLNYTNSFEKNAFLKIIDNVLSNKPKNYKNIEKILNQTDGQLKNADSKSITDVLALMDEEFALVIQKEFTNTVTQLDIITDILTKDGNSMMKREWLARLYEKEVKKIKSKLKEFKTLIDDEDSGNSRVRDYKIYRECLQTAYTNDQENNQENKITKDEQSILITLAKQLDLSQEEVKLINYMIVPLKPLDIDEIIKYLTKIGVIFYSRKNYQVYVADEIIEMLRKVRGKEVADKTFRRILRNLKDSQINLLARKHNIDRKLDRSNKIKEIINEGISLTSVLTNGIFKDDVKKSEKRTFLNDLIEGKLKITETIKGASFEAKMENLIHYLKNKNQEDKVSISINGYEKLITDLSKSVRRLNRLLKDEFELQESEVLNAKFLLNYNIKPIDVLYLIEKDELKTFCQKYEISIRGNEVQNVLERYKDADDLLLDNYINIANRDLNTLKENGIDIKESELGIKFEDVTKVIFKQLGFEVDDTLKKDISDAKNKVDIILNLGGNDIIIIECKSIKEKGFNKYSSVSRQVKAYIDISTKKGYKITKTFIIAPNFSDDFVKECGLDYELNLSLITAASLKKILEEFAESQLDVFPYKLLLRDVVVDEDRVIKAIRK